MSYFPKIVDENTNRTTYVAHLHHNEGVKTCQSVQNSTTTVQQEKILPPKESVVALLGNMPI
jgi:hypothetical protein